MRYGEGPVVSAAKGGREQAEIRISGGAHRSGNTLI